jgi:PadR family transcriptional regulator, regulatory protein PadR
MAPLPPPRRTQATATVLHALSRGHRYGFDILDATGLQSGTVYPILRRLLAAGLVRAQWEAVHEFRAEQRPPRRYYQLTAAGQRAASEAIDRFPEVAADWSTAKPRPSPG